MSQGIEIGKAGRIRRPCWNVHKWRSSINENTDGRSEAFVEHKPYGKDTNSYTLAPRSFNIVRARLFEMATKDNRRTKSATSLLAQIEVWRLEHGRQNGEPRSLAVEFEASWPTVPVTSLQPDVARGG